MAQKTIPLYEGAIPNSKPTTQPEITEQRWDVTVVSNITQPTLSIYLPPAAKATGTAVIICPGGGYWVNAITHEGTDVAQKFLEMGVAAIVLKYRIPNAETMITPEIGPLQDAQQAIKVVRTHAKEWQINPERIGLMGFSAGGHVASTAGTHFQTAVIDNTANVNLRPDFLLLIYPVISFRADIGHAGSREQLIGKTPAPEKVDLYSNEKQVTSRTPPSFLVHASDDNTVPVANSIVFYQKLLEHNVPAEIHLYQGGGHGFGLTNKTTSDPWIDRCRAWLAANGWLKPH